MPDFLQRRRLARILDRSADRLSDVQKPEKGWIATMRLALGMSAEQVAKRKGVSRNAVYQAERSELDGAVSLKQMEKTARAMGGRFVYAFVPDAPIEQLKYQQALHRAHTMAGQHPEFASWPAGEQQDWIDDTAAQQLHDMPSDFWDTE
ncbi:mobile mystery protein A [Octadecabacter temperatus]|uniref:Helix-turn-helix protein n=1 Tax=Octadecabacter temperatus TaxID=1458307 RepID=A0A0K0Y2P8_9RHOB|nr:helix-turn-helix domain-containing protein [Octadecabacter temperatus]AKS45200.1 helix-turn-helix protein [Octadecabacter temperatus]SIN88143.1 mobile mystery protein A [Octadecabacter temperatus]